MRRVGLIGGLSWAASAEYYRIINEDVQARLGGNHSAELLMRSLDFARILPLADDRPMVEDILYDAAHELIAGGARYLALASFTGHSYARRIRDLPVSLIDLADVVREAVVQTRLERIGILATGRSLLDPILLDLLSCGGDIELIMPDAPVQAEIDRIIFAELAVKAETPASVQFVETAIDRLVGSGAQAILLGTTEFSRIKDSLARQDLLIDAALIHCRAIVDRMLD